MCLVMSLQQLTYVLKRVHAHPFIDTRPLGDPEEECPHHLLSRGSQNSGSLSLLSSLPPHPTHLHVLCIFPIKYLLNLLTLCHLQPLSLKLKSPSPFLRQLQWPPNRSTNIHSGFLCSSQFFLPHVKIGSCPPVIYDTSRTSHCS